MSKMVSAAEFKAKCLQLIAQMEQDGESVTITRRGKPVAELKPKLSGSPGSVFGMLRSPLYRDDWDHEAPVIDPSDWEALRDEEEPRRS